MATEIPGPEPQPDGVYPRVNAELLGSGEYLDMIVSVVGRFHGTATQLLHRYMQDPSSAGVTFLCCDGKTIELMGELEDDALPDMGVSNDLAVEIIGVAQSRNKVMVGLGIYRFVQFTSAQFMVTYIECLFRLMCTLYRLRSDCLFCKYRSLWCDPFRRTWI
jgi:hypothetical protein